MTEHLTTIFPPRNPGLDGFTNEFYQTRKKECHPTNILWEQKEELPWRIPIPFWKTQRFFLPTPDSYFGVIPGFSDMGHS